MKNILKLKLKCSVIKVGIITSTDSKMTDYLVKCSWVHKNSIENGSIGFTIMYIY